MLKIFYMSNQKKNIRQIQIQGSLQNPQPELFEDHKKTSEDWQFVSA